MCIRDSPTRFIYVELVDKRDSVRRRIKVIENWNGFHNNLNLPRNLPSGHYLLRGYTQWMQNEDEAFFFKKVIPIVNPAPVSYTHLDVYKRQSVPSLLFMWI